MDKRLEDLELRVRALEERLHCSGTSTTNMLLIQYGEAVHKTVAAKILGVTRATIYHMLEDGRISGYCGGSRVSVRSIAKYMETPGITAYARKELDKE